VAGTNVTIDQTATALTINAAGGVGGTTTLQNTGAGAGIWKNTIANVASLRTLVSSNSSVQITAGTDTVDIQTLTMPYTGINALPTARLLGRSTAGTGVAEAISIGANLTLSGGVLSAAGGGSLGAALAALNALTPAANKVPYFTNGTTAALADFTSIARNVVAQTGGSEMLAQMGISYFSNANGISIRIPIPGIGGIQICSRTGLASGAVTTALGSDFTSANVAWTYPQAFSAVPSVTSSCSPGAFYTVGGTSSNTTTTANVKAAASISDAGGGFFSLIAIGIY
jgi:hypothetical protein